MPIDQTLERVDALVAAGDLAGARTRLRSLVVHAPRRLDVRERLADVYRRSGDAQQAGRWGYLSDGVTEAELTAFARSLRDDPRSMMRALRWAGDEDGTGSAVAEDRLRSLRSRAEEDAGHPVGWDDPPPGRGSVGSRWFVAGALLVVGGLLACLVVGAVTIVRWVVGLIT